MIQPVTNSQKLNYCKERIAHLRAVDGDARVIRNLEVAGVHYLAVAALTREFDKRTSDLAHKKHETPRVDYKAEYAHIDSVMDRIDVLLDEADQILSTEFNARQTAMALQSQIYRAEGE
jgi:hypothetical protein